MFEINRNGPGRWYVVETKDGRFSNTYLFPDGTVKNFEYRHSESVYFGTKKQAEQTLKEYEMTNAYPKSISAAAKWLDSVQKDWATKINLHTLNMSRNDYCVLGQVFGGWMNAMKLHFPKKDVYEDNVKTDRIFGRDASVDTWTKEILSRRVVVIDFNRMVELVNEGKEMSSPRWHSSLVKANIPTTSFRLLDINATDYFEVVKLPTVLDVKTGQKFKIVDGPLEVKILAQYVFMRNSYAKDFSGDIFFTNLDNGAIFSRTPTQAKLYTVEVIS